MKIAFTGIQGTATRIDGTKFNFDYNKEADLHIERKKDGFQLYTTSCWWGSPAYHPIEPNKTAVLADNIMKKAPNERTMGELMPFYTEVSLNEVSDANLVINNQLKGKDNHFKISNPKNTKIEVGENSYINIDNADETVKIAMNNLNSSVYLSNANNVELLDSNTEKKPIKKTISGKYLNITT